MTTSHLADFLHAIESKASDLKDASNKSKAENLASEARGFISAARRFGIIDHATLKKAFSDIDKAINEWNRHHD